MAKIRVFERGTAVMLKVGEMEFVLGWGGDNTSWVASVQKAFNDACPGCVQMCECGPSQCCDKCKPAPTAIPTPKSSMSVTGCSFVPEPVADDKTAEHLAMKYYLNEYRADVARVKSLEPVPTVMQFQGLANRLDGLEASVKRRTEWLMNIDEAANKLAGTVKAQASDLGELALRVAAMEGEKPCTKCGFHQAIGQPRQLCHCESERRHFYQEYDKAKAAAEDAARAAPQSTKPTPWTAARSTKP